MPANIATGDVVEVAFEGVHDQQRVLNLFHYRIDKSDPAAVTQASFINSLHAKLNATGGLIPTFLAAVSGDYLLSDVRYQFQYPTRWAAVTKDVGEVGGGPASLPPADSATFTLRAEQAGRRYRRSLHLPALPADWVSEGLIETGFMTNFNDLGAKLIEKINISTGLDATPVILHRAAYGSSPQIADFSIVPQVRTMKRRVVGRGI